MPRHELLESILEAQFEFEYSEPTDIPARREQLNQLLDTAIGDRDLTRRDLLSILRDRYKRARLIAEARRHSV